MLAVFADTGFYAALVNPKDRLHGTAILKADSYRGTVITTEYVLIELGNYLGRSARQDFITLVKKLRHDPNTVIVPASTAFFEKGLHLYGERQDKTWSLTDCISFVVMEEQGIGDALGFDRHFQQAGFRLFV